MSSDKDKNVEKEEMMPINAMVILEVIGKPKEHLVETLDGLVDNISKEKGIKIIDRKTNEPVGLEKHEGFFTTFTELELRFEDIRNLVGLVFKYMPAHVDIIEPEKLHLSNYLITEMLNELVRRLHGYDEIARVIQMEKKVLENKLREILGKIKEAKEKKQAKSKDKKEKTDEKKDKE